jgi:hypothetical protein
LAAGAVDQAPQVNRLTKRHPVYVQMFWINAFVPDEWNVVPLIDVPPE